jgi:hypothetical protein
MIVLLSLVALVAHADPPCDAWRYANDVIPFAQQGIAITKDLAVKDVAAFCHATTHNQAQHDMVGLDSTLDSDEKVRAHKIQDAWRAEYFPDAEVRRKGILNNLDLENQGITSLPKLKSFLAVPQDGTLEGSVELGDLKQDPRRLSQIMGFGKREAAVMAACNEILFGLQCPTALNKVIEMSVPLDFGNFTQPQLYQEILGNDAYDAGLRRAALKLLDRMQKRDVKGADLFSDVRNGFLEVGVPAAKAEEMTWKTMGLIATGGPNTGVRLNMIKTPLGEAGRKVALIVLATVPFYLDSLTMASGHPYSYPPTVHSTCDTGKPYHFWLPAYLGWELARTGTDARPAATAAFLGEKGYQMMADTETRDPTQPLREAFLSPYQNSIRMDLVMAAAGATFGASAGRAQGIDVDAGVRKIVMDSNPVDRLSEQASRALFDSPVRFARQWSQLMAPNAALNIYLEKLP